MSQNKSRKNRRNKNSNFKVKNKKIDHVVSEQEDELDEADKILLELEEIEKRKSKNISSKVRDLIQDDKIAIGEYNKKIEQDIETDENEVKIIEDEKKELDFLDDEDLVTPEDLKEEDKQDEQVDFLASLDKRTEHIVSERIRKKQPKRLKNNEDIPQGHIFVSTIKELGMSGIKNIAIMISMIALFIILMVAIILDRDNVQENEGDFLKMDTTKIISLMNNYYQALGEGDITKIRGYLADGSTVSDDEILEKVKETQLYKDYICDSYQILECYVQQGIEKNEYIVYFKFEMKIKSVETPAVGMFSSYFIDNSKDEKTSEYLICNNILTPDTKQYNYMVKMSSYSNVTKLFDKTDDELYEACEKDEDLKKVVEALKSGSNYSEEGTKESETEPLTEDSTEGITKN